jgi:hypothetical protein
VLVLVVDEMCFEGLGFSENLGVGKIESGKMVNEEMYRLMYLKLGWNGVGLYEWKVMLSRILGDGSCRAQFDKHERVSGSWVGREDPSRFRTRRMLWNKTCRRSVLSPHLGGRSGIDCSVCLVCMNLCRNTGCKKVCFCRKGVQ